MKKLLLIVFAIAICVLTVFGVKSVLASSQSSTSLFEVVLVNNPNVSFGDVSLSINKHDLQGYKVVAMTNCIYNGKLMVLIAFAKK